MKKADMTARAEAVDSTLAPARPAVKAVQAITEKKSFQRKNPPGVAQREAENWPAATPPPMAQDSKPPLTMSVVKSVAIMVGYTTAREALEGNPE